MKRSNIPALLLLILYVGCSSEENSVDKELNKQIELLDHVMRQDSVDLKNMSGVIDQMNSKFKFSSTKNGDTDIWKSRITFKWNSDSSITMINSYKSYAAGFKRETILHINDSLLFIERFTPDVAVDTTKLNFVETIDYLSPNRTIKTLIRIANFETLQDSVQFRMLPFKNISKIVQEHYQFELNYCQDILDRN